jgi:hypothetical protein
MMCLVFEVAFKKHTEKLGVGILRMSRSENLYGKAEHFVPEPFLLLSRGK